MNQQRRPKLWIFGDSFASIENIDESSRKNAWQVAVARSLRTELNCCAIIGTDQDYCMLAFRNHLLEGNIMPEDYVVFTMTHPDRFFFYDQFPDTTNANLIDAVVASGMSGSQFDAVLGYFKHLIDFKELLNIVTVRLSWLNQVIGRYGLRRPLMLIAASGADYSWHANTFTDLRFSKGSLYDVQCNEWIKSQDDRVTLANWHGLDFRFNHLCLRNHQVLSEKITKHFKDDQAVDLTEGFHSGFLYFDSYRDRDFIDLELSQSNIDYWKIQRKSDDIFDSESLSRPLDFPETLRALYENRKTNDVKK